MACMVKGKDTLVKKIEELGIGNTISKGSY